MNRRIYLGIMALSIYFLYNARFNLSNYREAPSFTNKHEWFLVNTTVTQNTRAQLEMRTWQIADGRDQSEDCLRTGGCTL